MPGGDRTGPAGGGPKTGRGVEYCNDNDHPGYAQGVGLEGRRGGRGHGFGVGRGWRNRFNAGFGRGRGRGGFAVDVQESNAFQAEN